MIGRIDWYRLLGLALMATSVALVVATVWWALA